MKTNGFSYDAMENMNTTPGIGAQNSESQASMSQLTADARQEVDGLILQLSRVTELRSAGTPQCFAKLDAAAEFLNTICNSLDSDNEHQYVKGRLNDLAEKYRKDLFDIAGQAKTIQEQCAELERKRSTLSSELDSVKLRLASVRGSRAPYQDEYDELYKEYEVLYAAYVSRFRNKVYLKAELRLLRQRIEEQMESPKMQTDPLAASETISGQNYLGELKPSGSRSGLLGSAGGQTRSSQSSGSVR